MALTGSQLNASTITTSGLGKLDSLQVINGLVGTTGSFTGMVSFNQLTASGDIVLLQNLYATGSSGAGFFNELHVSTGSLYIGNNVVLTAPDDRNLTINAGVIVTNGTTMTTGTFTSLTGTSINLSTITSSSLAKLDSLKVINGLVATTGVFSSIVSTGAITIDTLNVTHAIIGTTGTFDQLTVAQINMGTGSEISSPFDTLYLDANMNVSNIFTIDTVTGFITLSYYTGGNMYPMITMNSINGSMYCTGGTGGGFFNKLTVNELSATTFNVVNNSFTNLVVTNYTGTNNYMTNITSTNVTGTNVKTTNLSAIVMTGTTAYIQNLEVVNFTGITDCP